MIYFISHSMQNITVVDGRNFSNLMAVDQLYFIVPSHTHFADT